jgi:L-ascorbate metabolism protein UlaG (beta-lactamase superfamily)
LAGAGTRRALVSGDTVLYDGVRQVAERFEVDTAIMHLGAVRFPITGPIRYSMTIHDAIELTRLIRPREVIPVHHEGWSHFSERTDVVERTLTEGPDEVREMFRLLPIGLERSA